MKLFYKGLRLALRRAGLFLFIFAVGFGGWFLLRHPDTPLPKGWNPLEPLRTSDAFTPLTEWKLRRTLASRELCRAALADASQATPMDDFVKDKKCHIKNRVKLSRVGQAALTPVETTCNTALRMAMWEAHGIQPAAERHLKEPITKISHFSSYNCRAMRTGMADPTRMSSHATASAIDISGFTRKSGKLVDLKRDWQGDDAEALFLRDVNEAACMWFRVTLGPRYNALHADHFHLQGPGWGLCR